MNQPPKLGSGEGLPEGYTWRSYHCLLSTDGLLYEVEAVGPKRCCRAGRTWEDAINAVSATVHQSPSVIDKKKVFDGGAGP